MSETLYTTLIENKAKRNTLLLIIFTFFLFFIINVPLIKADTNKIDINLSADTNTVAVGDTFNVTVSIKAGTDASNINLGQLNIPGLEKFSTVSSYNQTQLQMINGVTAVLSNHTESIVARQVGTYTLGPVVIDDGNGSTTHSNSISIKVVAQPQGQSALATNNKSNSSGNNNLNSPITNSQTTPHNLKLNSTNIRDGFLWFFIIILLAYIIYDIYSKKQIPIVDSDQKDTTYTQADKATKVPTQLNIALSPNEQLTTPVPTSEPFDFQQLQSITDKSFYNQVMQAIEQFVTVHSDYPVPQTNTSVSSSAIKEILTKSNLSTEQKQTLNNILAECDVGKYAPDDPLRKQKIISQLKTL